MNVSFVADNSLPIAQNGLFVGKSTFEAQNGFRSQKGSKAMYEPSKMAHNFWVWCRAPHFSTKTYTSTDVKETPRV